MDNYEEYEAENEEYYEENDEQVLSEEKIEAKESSEQNYKNSYSFGGHFSKHFNEVEEIPGDPRKKLEIKYFSGDNSPLTNYAIKFVSKTDFIYCSSNVAVMYELF